MFSQLKSTFKTEDLPPLPEGTHLSSSSPPLALPALPPMLFNLPPSFPTTPLPSTRYNTSWNAIVAAGSHLPGLAPSTILRIEGNEMPPLHHPHPYTTLATSGITLTSPSRPTSLLYPSSVPQATGASLLSRSESPHQSRSQLPDHLDNPHGEKPYKKLMSGSNHLPTSLPKGTHWQDSEGGGPSSQTTQILPQRYSLRQSMSTESMEKVPHPPSRRSNPRQLPDPLPMMLPDAIHLFGEVNMPQPPSVLLHADYNTLFSYFAYELLASPVWASTTTRREYFYFSERNIPCNNIL